MVLYLHKSQWKVSGFWGTSPCRPPQLLCHWANSFHQPPFFAFVENCSNYITVSGTVFSKLGVLCLFQIFTLEHWTEVKPAGIWSTISIVFMAQWAVLLCENSYDLQVTCGLGNILKSIWMYSGMYSLPKTNGSNFLCLWQRFSCFCIIQALQCVICLSRF